MLKIKAETDRSQTGQTIQTSEIIISAIQTRVDYIRISRFSTEEARLML